MKMKLLAVPALLVALSASAVVYAETAGQFVDDTAITTKVKGAILDDPQLKVTQISVRTDNGTVQLSGTVNTTADEARAVNLARNVNGVKDVQDHLSIHSEPSQDD
jgi:hyperosmotically inducible protein